MKAEDINVSPFRVNLIEDGKTWSITHVFHRSNVSDVIDPDDNMNVKLPFSAIFDDIECFDGVWATVECGLFVAADGIVREAGELEWQFSVRCKPEAVISAIKSRLLEWW